LILLVVTVIKVISTSDEKNYTKKEREREREREREENELRILANNRIPKGKEKRGRKKR